MLERLEWDSEFFGFGVGRWRVTGELDVDRITQIRRSASADLRLVYLHSPVALPARLAGARLVDRKTTYARPLAVDLPSEISATVVPWNETLERTALDRLAVQAGLYSRFAVDPQMPVGSFERLYRLWMQRSVEKQLADEVLVIAQTGVPVAMITVALKAAVGHIGLVAVDDRQRGRGLGRALLQAADHWCAAQGATEMQVVTQGDNLPACRLYEAAGYRVCEQEFLYHLWL